MRNDNREYSGWVKPYDTNFPFVIQFSEYNSERKIYPVRIAFATGGEALIADVALEGTSKIPIDFIVRGDIPNIQKSGDSKNEIEHNWWSRKKQSIFSKIFNFYWRIIVSIFWNI